MINFGDFYQQLNRLLNFLRINGIHYAIFKLENFIIFNNSLLLMGL